MSKKECFRVKLDFESGTGVIENLTKNTEYEVDTYEPYCECEAFRYAKRNKSGHKKLCKHLKLAANIE